MSANFYNKHRKIIGVILVALFVAGGGMLSINSAYAASYSRVEENGNYYIRMGVLVSAGGTGAASPFLYTKKVITKEQYDALANATDQQLETAYNSAADPGTSGSVSAAGEHQTTNAAVSNAANEENNGATLGDLVGRMVSWVLYGVALGLGYIFMLATKVMLYVATFNKFLDQPAVQAGWTITRDICNNFFIVFIMIMAIGTILQLQLTQWRNMLPKIIMSAVLINFSMMFTGILIDVSQVIMLTFASPLASTHAYNIILAAFGLPNAYQFEGAMNAISGSKDNAAPAGLGWWDIISALMFAILVTIVAICVVVAIAGVLVYRIVVLWFLVVLSPLWIFGKAFDKLSMLTSEWMGQFTKYFIVGPAMMFCIYLSFLTMAKMNFAADKNVLDIATASDSAAGASGSDSVIKTSATAGSSAAADNLIALSKMASVNGVINFMIVCGLLIGSLVMAQRYGGAGAGWAKKGMGWTKSFTGAKLAETLGGMGAKRGKELLGDVTGFTVAKGAVNQYLSDNAKARQTKRADKISTASGRIAAGVGAAKETASSAITAIPKAVKGKIDNMVSGKSIERAKSAIESDQLLLKAKEKDLKAKKSGVDKEKNKLNELESDKARLDSEIGANSAIQQKLQEYGAKASAISSGAFAMGTPEAEDYAMYSKNIDGTWKKSDASGNVIQKSINEEDLQYSATGYRDDFEEKRAKAEQAFVAGKPDEAFFEEGAYRYESLGNGNWNKVNKKKGGAGVIVADDRLRLEAGRKAAAMEIEDEIVSAKAEAANADVQIASQQAAVAGAEKEVVDAQKDMDLIKANISNEEEQIKKAKRRQAAADKIMKLGMYGAAAGLGAAFAPAGLGALGISGMSAAATVLTGEAAGVALAGGAQAAAKGLESAGKTDRKLASNLNSNGIKTASEGLKELSDGDIMTRLDDATLGKFDKIALQMEAMNRELLSTEKAKAAKEEILQKTSDYRGRNDKKVSAQLNSIMERKYRSLTSTFSDLSSSDPTKQRVAQEAIDEGIMGGHYKMEALDDSALQSTVDRFADKLGFSSFKKQFDALNENQRELAKNTLIAKQALLSDKAKGNLARLTNVSVAFGEDRAAAEKFVGGLNAKDLKAMLLEGSAEQSSALAKLIGKNLAILDERVRRQIANNTSEGKAIKGALNP